MRITALIVAATAALALTACQNADALVLQLADEVQEVVRMRREDEAGDLRSVLPVQREYRFARLFRRHRLDARPRLRERVHERPEMRGQQRTVGDAGLRHDLPERHEIQARRLAFVAEGQHAGERLENLRLAARRDGRRRRREHHHRERAGAPARSPAAPHRP